MDLVKGTAVAAALLMLAACGNPPVVTPIASTSPSPAGTPGVTPGATPSASPAFPSPTAGGPTPPAPATVKCASRALATANLALVRLRNTAGVIVRDITDLSKPVSRCVITGTGTSYFRFVSVSRVSYIITKSDGSGALYLVDLLTQHTSLVRAWTNGGTLYWVYAWSPDASTLSYLSSNGDKVEWHTRSSAGDVKLSDLGSVPGRGVDQNSDDVLVGFSADGRYVALENTFTNSTGPGGQVAPFQVVHLADHKLVYSRTAGTMAAWAAKGATLYFRTTSGVESWDPTGATHVIVPQGFKWIRPWPSADGKLIAYVDAGTAGNHFPGYVRLSDKQAIRVSTRPRTGAAFLNSRLMWYSEEAACPAGCGFGGPALTGRTYIYDVVARTETPSIIAAFFDAWPRSS